MLDPAQPPSAPVPRRALIPREHGAYGQLALPLVAALAIGRPTLASAALTAAFVAAFLSHESLLVATGQRGRRVREEDGARARRTLSALGGLALVAAAVGVALAPGAARAALVPPALLAGAVAWLAMRRLETTTGGEMVAGAALSSGSLPVALAGGASLRAALACWVTWVLAFAAATLAVQVVLARARTKGRSDPGAAYAAGALALLGLAVAASEVAGLPRAAPIALAPTALLSAGVCVARVSAKRLRELGWAMVVASIATTVLLVAGLRPA